MLDNKYWLSILLPSKRPDELEQYINSLKKNAVDFNSVQLIVLLDEDRGVGPAENIKYINFPHQTASDRMEICFRMSTGKNILFGNDDLVMHSPNWDAKFKSAIDKFPDEVFLIWPDDKIFRSSFACFPLVSRKLLEQIKFFPMPYKQYKIDDTLFEVIPAERKLYLPDVIMEHTNNQGVIGKKFPGGVYPIDPDNMTYDTMMYNKQMVRREEMREKLGLLISKAA